MPRFFNKAAPRRAARFFCGLLFFFAASPAWPGVGFRVEAGAFGLAAGSPNPTADIAAGWYSGPVTLEGFFGAIIDPAFVLMPKFHYGFHLDAGLPLDFGQDAAIRLGIEAAYYDGEYAAIPGDFKTKLTRTQASVTPVFGCEQPLAFGSLFLRARLPAALNLITSALELEGRLDMGFTLENGFECAIYPLFHFFPDYDVFPEDDLDPDNDIPFQYGIYADSSPQTLAGFGFEASWISSDEYPVRFEAVLSAVARPNQDKVTSRAQIGLRFGAMRFTAFAAYINKAHAAARLEPGMAFTYGL